MKVELDIFSGRPNPQWELSDEAAAKVSTKLNALSQVAKSAPDPGLGYRGFILRDGGRVMRVFQSQVTIDSPGFHKTLKDNSGIEGDLADEARRHGFDDLVKDIPSAK